MEEREKPYPNRRSVNPEPFQVTKNGSELLSSPCLPALPCFQVYPGVSTNKNNKGTQVLQTKQTVIPSRLPHQWMNGAPRTREEQYPMCLGILIIRLLRTRPVQKFVFPVAPGATKIQREQKKKKKMVLLRSIFEIHFPSVVGTCQSNS